MKAIQNLSEPSSRGQDVIAALIKSIGGGDERAMAQLYDMTSRMIYGLVLRILNDEATSEEVLLDVYTQAWRQAASYDARGGAPLAWLTTIARARAIDRLRSGNQGERPQMPPDTIVRQSAEANVEERAYITEVQARVKPALHALSPEQREAIELAYYGGLSYSEIAGRLGQPPGVVKANIRSGMTKIREVLKPGYVAGI